MLNKHMQPKKLSLDVVKLLLERLKDEYTAFYTYRAASNYLKNKGLNLASAYFAKESEDELTHAKKLEDFIVDWNVDVELPMIEKPQCEFKNLMEILETAYGLEYDLYNAYIETSAKIFDMGELQVYDFLNFFRDVQNTSVIEYSDMFNILEGVNTDSKFELLQLEETLFGD